MDEPTGDLDINSRQMVWDAISEVQTHSNASFLISTQHLEEAEYLSS
jgi:ABC-type multidrug transport system ATPase subunit